jgi:hypothetical protein
MKQFPSSNDESSSEYKKYYEVLNNLSNQIDHNGTHLETKRQLYKNFLCYDDLY